ncbi:AMIN-like domain-containing (lipo)protein [Modestobacter italicus]|uniref:AMIN-like domain-containing (lipo)protein n=1 Tax=Modestobacter italicus (strain DSM 44449 / CECT 9708 / BC 501) TaxID=2732864 RepID=UPI00059F75EC|nr:hypothetical protein [Modestobacter marinus]
MLTRRPSRVAGFALLAVAVLSTGCAAQTDPDDAASTGSAPASASTTASAPAGSSDPAGSSSSAATATEEAEGTPFPGDTQADVADAVDPDGLTVTAVRAASHDGFDRVVFELSGSGTPGWRVEYVDAPTAQGSGAAIDVPGAAYLAVSLQGTSYPYDSGAEEVARGAVPVSGTDVVQGVFYDATFEGVSAAVIGTADQAPFRVYSLTGPSRVVVEVATAG